MIDLAAKYGAPTNQRPWLQNSAAPPVFLRRISLSGGEKQHQESATGGDLLTSDAKDLREDLFTDEESVVIDGVPTIEPLPAVVEQLKIQIAFQSEALEALRDGRDERLLTVLQRVREIEMRLGTAQRKLDKIEQLYPGLTARLAKQLASHPDGSLADLCTVAGPMVKSSEIELTADLRLRSHPAGARPDSFARAHPLDGGSFLRDRRWLGRHSPRRGYSDLAA